MIPSDRRLITQYLSHNEQFAFEQLVYRHSEMVMKVCRKMLAQHADMDDAFQATFLVLAKKLHTLRNRASVAGWLYEVATRNCLQIRQRRHRTREVQVEIEIGGTGSASAPNQMKNLQEPWEILSNTQEASVVLSEINSLPSKYREVIVLCCIDEHSRRDTACMLNRTEATVKGLLTRARILLRNRLVQKGIAPAAALVISQAETCLGASVVVNRCLMTSTLQICSSPIPSGLKSGAATAPASKYVYAIATESLRQMATTATTKLATLAAAILIAVSIPLGLLAKNSISTQASNATFSAAAAHNKGATEKPQELESKSEELKIDGLVGEAEEVKEPEKPNQKAGLEDKHRPNEVQVKDRERKITTSGLGKLGEEDEASSDGVKVISSTSYRDHLVKKGAAGLKLLRAYTKINPSFHLAEIEELPMDVVKVSTFQQIEEGKAKGFRLLIPNDQIARKFLDTNGDLRLDQWVFYQDGEEVYRDADLNFDGRVDRFYLWQNGELLGGDLPLPKLSEADRVLKDQASEARMKMVSAKTTLDSMSQLIRKGFVKPEQADEAKKQLKEVTNEYHEAMKKFINRLNEVRLNEVQN